MGKFISIYNFIAQWCDSFGNQRILNYRVMVVLDTMLQYDNICQKYISTCIDHNF